MIRKYMLILGMAVSVSGYSQLYVPGGAAAINSIPATGTNIGIGVASPQSKLDVGGDIRLSGYLNVNSPNFTAGLTSEVGGLTPLLNFGVNFRGIRDSQYFGAAFRIDMRTMYSPFQWVYRSAGSTTDNVIMELGHNGDMLGLRKSGSVTGVQIHSGVSNASLQFLRGGVKHGGMVFDGYKIVFKGLSTADDYNPDLALNSTEQIDAAFLGNVSIGTLDPKGYRLAIAGKAVAEEIVVKLQTAWPDYVFDAGYQVPSLKDVEAYIRINRHLPGVPSAEEVKENGVEVGAMNAILLKKIEELTLHLIELEKKNEHLDARVKQLESGND